MFIFEKLIKATELFVFNCAFHISKGVRKFLLSKQEEKGSKKKNLHKWNAKGGKMRANLQEYNGVDSNTISSRRQKYYNKSSKFTERKNMLYLFVTLFHSLYSVIGINSFIPVTSIWGAPGLPSTMSGHGPREKQDKPSTLTAENFFTILIPIY